MMIRMRTALALAALVAAWQTTPLEARDPGDQDQPAAAQPAPEPEAQSSAESTAKPNAASEPAAPVAKPATPDADPNATNDAADRPERFVPTQKTTADNSATFPVDI
jgi:hypothetical protein